MEVLIFIVLLFIWISIVSVSGRIRETNRLLDSQTALLTLAHRQELARVELEQAQQQAKEEAERQARIAASEAQAKRQAEIDEESAALRREARKKMLSNAIHHVKEFAKREWH